MQATHAQARSAAVPLAERLAAGPISWGACEVPGWGVMPSPETVLTEMAELGLRGTELGPPGFLPEEPKALADMLARHGLALVGGFVPLVLHEPELDQALVQTRRAARLMSEAGGRMLVLAAVLDVDWGAPRELGDEEWERMAKNLNTIETLAAEEYGMAVALHPHAGTLIETAAQVQRALDVVEVGWCLDTGHLLIGGTDPVQFARDYGDRVNHVHLKDVNGGLAAEVRKGRRSLLSATKDGLFTALGRGDAQIAEVSDGLQGHGYDGWLVLEQDTAIEAPLSGAADRSTNAPLSGAADRSTNAPPSGAADRSTKAPPSGAPARPTTGDEPTVAGGPMCDARESIAFLHHTARTTTEEINR